MQDPDDKTLLDELFGEAADEDAADGDVAIQDVADREVVVDEVVDDDARTPFASESSAPEPFAAGRSATAPPSDAEAPGTPQRRGEPRWQGESRRRGESEPRVGSSRAIGPSAPGRRAARQLSELPEPGLADAVASSGAVRDEPGAGPRAATWRDVVWARSGVRPAAAPGCREIGLTTTGFAIFVTVDSIMMYTPFRTPGPTSLLPQAITLALLAFGLGALMIWSIRGAARPVGAGMMLGWVFMTLISAGYFTGLNP
jgi:hypothetical protein